MTAGPTDRRLRLAGLRRLTAPALVLAAGAALAACQPASMADAAPAAAVEAPATAPSSAAAPTVVPSSPAPFPVASAAPSSTASTSTATPAPAPSPLVTITCPPGGAVRAATFDHTVAAAAPYTVTITYGDGRSYSGDDRHLAAVFAHTYAASGSFDVTATVTDAAGRSAHATCSWTRTAPVAAAAAAAVASGGTGSDHYTNVDGNPVHRPEAAPSAPDGATAQCGDGTYSFSQHHSGTCSHHGGVASWL